MAKKLTQKQLKYVDNRVKGKSQVESAMLAYPNQTYKAAATQSTRNENNPKISEKIEQALKKKNLTMDTIAEKISEGLEANKCVYDVASNELVETDKADHTIRHKYLTTLIDITGVRAPEKKQVDLYGLIGMIAPEEVAKIRQRI